VSNNGQRIPSGSANIITAIKADSDDVPDLKPSGSPTRIDPAELEENVEDEV
jgi:acetylglutamate kinase